jgi:hypothetical protein
LLGEYQIGFRRVKGTIDAIGMVRIISERTVDIDEEFFTCFIDEQVFDRVNCKKIMSIQETSVSTGASKFDKEFDIQRTVHRDTFL